MSRAPRSRGSHVERETLLVHAEGGALPASGRSHLEACLACRDELAAIERLVQDLRAPALAIPPDPALDRAVALFPTRPPLVERVTEAIGRMVRGVGLAPLALAGVRGGSLATVRLLFEHEALQVDVEVSPAQDGLALTGQALAPGGDPASGFVWAERAGYRSDETALDRHGMFQLERIPAGPFDLVFDLGDRRIRFEARPTE